MSWAFFHEIRFISTYLYPFLVRSPMDGELLGLEWGHDTSSKRHNIS